MNKELIALRVKSFLFELGSLVGVGLVGVFLSPEFQALVTTHAGTGVVGSLIVLVVTGLVKHVRNIKLSKKLGSDLVQTPATYI